MQCVGSSYNQVITIITIRHCLNSFHPTIFDRLSLTSFYIFKLKTGYIFNFSFNPNTANEFQSKLLEVITLLYIYMFCTLYIPKTIQTSKKLCRYGCQETRYNKHIQNILSNSYCLKRFILYVLLTAVSVKKIYVHVYQVAVNIS